MLVGECPKCGAIYSGWALKSPWYQICDRCGVDIDIRDTDSDIITAHSTYSSDQNKETLSREVPYPYANHGE